MRKLLLLAISLPLLLTCACTTTAPEQAKAEPKLTLRHRVLYTYEHVYLPATWFNNGTELTQDIRENGANPLQGLLLLATSQVAKADALSKDIDNMRVSLEKTLDKISVERFQPEDSGTAQGWLVTLPEPRVTPECSYVMMYFDGSRVRYFTCEFDNESDRTLWFLCEWTEDGSHRNYGNCCDGTKRNFTDNVVRVVSENKLPSAIWVPDSIQ